MALCVIVNTDLLLIIFLENHEKIREYLENITNYFFIFSVFKLCMFPEYSCILQDK